MSPIERADATLRQIDATLAACEPPIERAKALLAPESAPELEVPADAPSSVASPGPFRRFYASWLMVWRRLVWLACLGWLPADVND